jgi:hypothetical protein
MARSRSSSKKTKKKKTAKKAITVYYHHDVAAIDDGDDHALCDSLAGLTKEEFGYRKTTRFTKRVIAQRVVDHNTKEPLATVATRR